MSMSLIKVYQTPTTTNERLPTEQQNGYHGVATEQFIEGVITHIASDSMMDTSVNSLRFSLGLSVAAASFDGSSTLTIDIYLDC